MREEDPDRCAERDHNMRPISREMAHIANHDTNDRPAGGANRDLDDTQIFPFLSRASQHLRQIGADQVAAIVHVRRVPFNAVTVGLLFPFHHVGVAAVLLINLRDSSSFQVAGLSRMSVI
jgi:hypothetical protein